MNTKLTHFNNMGRKKQFKQFHPRCWDCGSVDFSYSPMDIEIMGIYRVRCDECGKLYEDERAKNMLIASGEIKE